MEQQKQLLPFYAHAVEHISVGIHAIDADGKTLLYNAKMKEIEGNAFDDMTNQSLVELFAFRKDSTLLRVLQTGRKEVNVKQTYWNKSGHEITTINDTFPIFEEDKLIGAIEFARDITSLEKLIYQPLRRYGEPLTFDVITAVSNEMQQVIANAKKAAHARIPVLLIGDSGTGKDLIAEGIHHALSPANDNFITLFSRRNKSILENVQAHLQSDKCYTFFFERIEFLSIDMQEELLDLLKELSLTKHMVIGSIGSDPIDLISSGQLLKDIYYFFANLMIIIPALCERKEDIAPFVADYFSRHRARFASTVQGLSPEVMDIFMSYDWPGNLKELELLLDEIASMMTNEEIVTYEMLPLHFRFKVQQTDTSTSFIPNNELLPLDEYLREAEIYYVQNVLKMFDGNVTKTAAALGMSRQNLQYRLRKWKAD
ncbi:sigma 54-interacting transcriptional regulator [Solibacillus sp. CAU 1738]|uniref:sigma 54-interacting transcriptional regulator n=1 Tax=Solibacillus sp. CAU 1738 TaxID=3140363 RepID=UPI00326195CA